MRHLLANYDSASRPVYNAGHTVVVKFGLTLAQIADMVSSSDGLIANSELHQPSSDHEWLLSCRRLLISPPSPQLSVFLHCGRTTQASSSGDGDRVCLSAASRPCGSRYGARAGFRDLTTGYAIDSECRMMTP
jgi:hypothetical protein